MSSEDVHTRYWSSGLALGASSHTVIYANDVMAGSGSTALHKQIAAIVQEGASMVMLETTTPVVDPFFLFDLKKRYGFSLVLLALDDEFKFDWISSSYSTIADLVLTLDFVAVDRYRQAGVNAHFFMLPMFLADEIPAAPLEPLSTRVSFVGRMDRGKPSRVALARFLAENGVEVRQFVSTGPGDPSFLTRDDMYAVFRHSGINLNFCGITTYLDPFENVLHDRVRGTKARPLEIASAGGFCLSEYSISLANLLSEDAEIAFFRTRDDLLEKIRYYLANPDVTRTIAKNAQRRVQQEYSSEALSEKLKALIASPATRSGLDLYGEAFVPRVNRLMAFTFCVQSLTKAFSLGLSGNGNFIADCSLTWKFVERVRKISGVTRTLALFASVIWNLFKAFVTYLGNGILQTGRRSIPAAVRP